MDTPDEINAPARLPRAFSLLTFDALESVAAEAATHARSGAAEGTLLHAALSRDSARYGVESEARRGNLYAALVLRPEGRADWAAELGLLGAVSLGRALAEVVEPPAELHYTWPNRLRLNQGDVAAVDLLGGPPGDEDADTVEWAVLALAVNVLEPLPPDTLQSAGLRREGGCEVDASEVLERFARQFLAEVGRWSDEGLSSVVRHWSSRVDFERPFLLPGDSPPAGEYDGLEADGSLRLRGDGGLQRISLADIWFGERR